MLPRCLPEDSRIWVMALAMLFCLKLSVSFFLSLSLFFFFGSPRQTGHLTGHSPIYPSFLSPILIAISCPPSLPPVLFTPNLPSLWSLSRHVWLICSDDTGRLLCVFVCQNASALISLMPALACFEAQGTNKALFFGDVRRNGESNPRCVQRKAAC